VGQIKTRVKRVPKKVQFTQERVEYNVFLFDDPLKGSKSLKTFKINLTFRFDKLSHLSKSFHIGENSQILTVSNKNSIIIHQGEEVMIMGMGHLRAAVRKIYGWA
jgi:hypothetical protein